MKLLEPVDMPQLLALGEKWSALHATCLRGVHDKIDDEVNKLTTSTVDFLREKLDEIHAAMVKNAPPEHPNLSGRSSRDRHFIGVTAAKLKKVNQIIEEQRSGSR
jgi:hypothetical protein